MKAISSSGTDVVLVRDEVTVASFVVVVVATTGLKDVSIAGNVAATDLVDETFAAKVVDVNTLDVVDINFDIVAGPMSPAVVLLDGSDTDTDLTDVVVSSFSDEVVAIVNGTDVQAVDVVVFS